MRSIRSSGLGPIRAIGLAAMLAATLAGTAMAQEAPVTLRLAVADQLGRPSQPYVEAFVTSVAERSGGAMTVEPIYGAGDSTGPGFERGTVQLLAEGRAELALSASRAWEHIGITGLNALQAPFLIDDDALAVAVAESPIAADLLSSMVAGGVTGLAIWPEDLRHPVALVGCADPLVTAASFDGLTIRAIESSVTFDLLEVLGATPTSGEWGDACAVPGGESGLRQGQSLPSLGTFTGDVTFFPKYQVLAANMAAFERLSDSQQDVIRGAAATVQRQAIAERPTDAEAASEWCAYGGTVALAGPEEIAAFLAAAQPVYDALAEDPATADAIDAIRALKETVVSDATIEACGLERAPGEAPVAAGGPTPIDGTYITSITFDELVAYPHRYDGGEVNDGNWGDITITFDAGELSIDLRNPREAYTSSGTYRLDGDVLVVFDPNACCPVTEFGFGWSLEGDTLTLTRLEDWIGPSTWIINPWTRVAE